MEGCWWPLSPAAMPLCMISVFLIPLHFQSCYKKFIVKITDIKRTSWIVFSISLVNMCWKLLMFIYHIYMFFTNDVHYHHYHSPVFYHEQDGGSTLKETQNISQMEKNCHSCTLLDYLNNCWWLQAPQHICLWHQQVWAQCHYSQQWGSSA